MEQAEIGPDNSGMPPLNNALVPFAGGEPGAPQPPVHLQSAVQAGGRSQGLPEFSSQEALEHAIQAERERLAADRAEAAKLREQERRVL